MQKLITTSVLLAVLSLSPIHAMQPYHRPFSTRSCCDYSSQPVARAHQGTDVCLNEQIARDARNEKALTALQNFVGHPLTPNQLPSIALACSGGGLRASLATLGILRGLEKIGLLDAVTYAAGNSGSTWTLAAWPVHNKGLDHLTQYLRSRICNTINPQNFDTTSLFKTFGEKLQNLRPFSLNDIWGAWLAGGFFGIEKSNIMLSDIAPQVSDGSYPIPLFCSVIGETAADVYQWVEFSPFQIGSEYLNAWISPDAFGKKFNKGTSFDSSKPENFGYLLGLFGSLYAAGSAEILNQIKEQLELLNQQCSKPSLSSLFGWTENIRLSPPDIYNFTYNLPNSPLADEFFLTFVDAGFEFALPFPPLLRRTIKLYIVCDASSNVMIESQNPMHDVCAYAYKNGYHFPAIDYTKLVCQKISIIHDPQDPQSPVIVYIPNQELFSTYKISYTNQEFDQLVSSMQDTVVNNAAAIKQAVAYAMNKQNPTLT